MILILHLRLFLQPLIKILRYSQINQDFQYQSHINYPISKFVKIPRRHHRRHHVRRETRNSRAGISLEPSLRNIVPSKAERSEPGRRIREAGRSVIKDDGV